MRALFLAAAALAASLCAGLQPAGAQSHRFFTPSAWGNGQPTGTTTIARPSGFDIVPPFAVWRTPDGRYRHDFDIASVKPTPSVILYVGPGGDNTKDGLSWANRLRSLRQALTRAQAQSATTVVAIRAQAGTYRSSSVDGSGINDSFTGQTIGRSVVIEPTDASGNVIATGAKIISVNDQVMPGFTRVGSTSVYVSDYASDSSVTPSPAAWDAARLNARGRPQALRNVPLSSANLVLDEAGNGVPLAQADIPAALEAMQARYGQGAMLRDSVNKKLYVRLWDGRAPDANLTVGRGQGNGISTGRNLQISASSGAGITIWLRDVELWGGNAYYKLGQTVGVPINFYAVDTAAVYSSGDGYHLDGPGTTVILRGYAGDNAVDGFGYGSFSNAGLHLFYELDSVAEWNGNVGDRSSNATTAHNKCRGVRVNDVYAFTYTRVLHDIQDAQSWNLGLKLGGTRLTDATSGGIVSGYLDASGVPQATRVWVDGATFDGAVTYGLEAYGNIADGGPGGMLYVRNTERKLNEDTVLGRITAY